MGWSSSSVQASGNNGTITSPLRIAKRDSPGRPKGPAVARRTSSSYRHVHNNNLVSKSPFKSQIPTPSTPSSRPPPIVFPTRRVSGEKRPRPVSMCEQAEAENDRPFALKRDRKQSKTFQGLIEKEPVTKSPFKVQQRPSIPEPKPPTPPIPLSLETQRLSSTPPTPSYMPTPAVASSGGPSPGRSSLVSRRMHGPRLSGGTKRDRRKTVTFLERCDVLEFDREDDTEEEMFEDAGDEDPDDSSHDMQMGSDPFINSSRSNNESHELMEEDASYESIQLSDEGFNQSPSVPSLLCDPDASITGIVDEMFFSSNAANLLSDISMASNNTNTPPRHNDIPTDFETEGGIPFGRSHHVDRFLQHQHSPHQSPPPHFSPHGSSPVQHNSHISQSPSSLPYRFNLPTHASPLGPPATPPRRSPALRHSTPPLGRSTHVERIRQARKEEVEVENVDKLPASPSPIKRTPAGSGVCDDGLIPKFDIGARAFITFCLLSLLLINVPSAKEIEPESYHSANISIDPFAPRLQDESALSDLQEEETCSINDSKESANVSIGNSEINLSALAGDCEEVRN